MRCNRHFAVSATFSILAITILATIHVHNRTKSGFVCLQCNNYTSRPSFERYTQQPPPEPSMEKSENRMMDRQIQDARSDNNTETFVNNTSTLPEERAVIRAPTDCVRINCREHLSKYEQYKMKACETRVRKVEHYKGPINPSDCKFLSYADRHPVALISTEGSGNTWTRGLLEKTTGICTGSIYCDAVLRAHGYVGENVKSGNVLVVKTHSPVPKWRGANNNKSISSDANYTSAIFILRNPFNSAVAEWNRKSARETLGKHNSTIHFESHTYTVPEERFKGRAWKGFLQRYMQGWKLRLCQWVINQDKYPVHILRYEDLEKNTLKEIQGTLNFLNVSYDSETVEDKLREDYSEFHRPHNTYDFEHYSEQQKQEVTSLLLEVMEAAERAGKSHLLRLNEYLSTVNA